MPKKPTTTTKNLLGNIKKPLHQQCHNRISVQFIQHPSKPRLSLFTTWSLFPFRFFFILFFLNQWKKKRGLPWRYLILSGSSTHFLNPQCYLEFGNQSIHTVSLFQSIPIYRQRRFIRTYASSTWTISHFSSTCPDGDCKMRPRCGWLRWVSRDSEEWGWCMILCKRGQAGRPRNSLFQSLSVDMTPLPAVLKLFEHKPSFLFPSPHPVFL